MRGVALALVGAMFLVGFSTTSKADPRVWTDHIPVGRPYVKPPVPARKTSMAEFEAQQKLALLKPELPAFTLDPVREAILTEITRLKGEAAGDDRRQRLLDQLGSLYGSELSGPFWVEGNAFKAVARKTAAEMARADEFAIDPGRFDTPPVSGPPQGGVAAGEVAMSLAVLAYAREAFGARFEPNDISLWLDHKPEVPEPAVLLPQVSSAADPGAELRKLHPSHPHFEQLRVAYLVATGKRAAPPPARLEQVPEGPVIKVGEDHPHVAIVRRRLDIPADGVAATFLDRELGNELRNYLKRNGKSRRREINDEVRALLNAPPPPAKMPDLKKIEANLLRWRWMPRDLGDVHIWNNIPEFQTRLVKNGAVVHEERIIVGQTDQQTPIFSDKMDHIVFKPQWGVPNSIKITDLLPKLRGGDHDVLDRRGMKIVKDGRTIEPERIRWETTDIRYLNIVQGPSAWNPLGEMKFMFPNRHSVYMHDTTSKSLFQNGERTYSHGCIRVRNPRKLAEVIYSEVQGWDVNEIPKLLHARSEENNRIDFARPIAVHNVYFTLVPDGQGGLRQLSDVYGHDRRIADALTGKSLQWIAANDPARMHQKRVEEIEKSTRYDNSSYSSASRKRVARSDDDGGRYEAYRSSLGAAAPARSYRPQRAPRQQVQRAPSWPPVFSFWND